jgi:hypothetical protein
MPIKPKPKPPAKVAAKPAPKPIPKTSTPTPPPKKRMETVSGLYTGTGGTMVLDLRIDIDGQRPMNFVSGDYYSIKTGVKRYLDSFIMPSPSIDTNNPNRVVLMGTRSNKNIQPSFPVTRITIDRLNQTALVEFFKTDGTPFNPTVPCSFVSPFFRKVEYEMDMEAGIQPFVSYDAAASTLEGPPNPRAMSVESIFAETGIQLTRTGNTSIVPSAGAGTDQRWSDAELHAAMTQQFSQWRNEPQWKMWLFLANLCEKDPNSDPRAETLGIMFDTGRTDTSQRQGLAVFYKAIENNYPLMDGVNDPSSIAFFTNARQRQKLFTTVHEIGHAFNLLHSWEKALSDPPGVADTGALSFMNYPSHYSDINSNQFGDQAFWQNFDFRFLDSEVLHLRHAFRDEIIFGGNPFQHGAAMVSQAHDGHHHGGLSIDFNDPVEDQSNLGFRIETKKTFLMGEPVVIDLKLWNKDPQNPKEVHTELHPKKGLVRIAIQSPDGSVKEYHPLMEYILIHGRTTLDSSKPAAYESAYIGYGKDGFYFDRTGYYNIRAVYRSNDGTTLTSNTVSLRVSHPFKKADEEIADLYFGQDQGQLFYLLGSDAASLKNGNAAFDLAIDKFKKHPLSVFAQLVKGHNAGREFKSFDGKKVKVRKIQATEHNQLLGSVIDASAKGKGIDNITLGRIMNQLAKNHFVEGNTQEAQKVVEKTLKIFEKQKLKKSVIEGIKAQAMRVLE